MQLVQLGSLAHVTRSKLLTPKGNRLALKSTGLTRGVDQIDPTPSHARHTNPPANATSRPPRLHLCRRELLSLLAPSLDPHCYLLRRELLWIPAATSSTAATHPTRHQRQRTSTSATVLELVPTAGRHGMSKDAGFNTSCNSTWGLPLTSPRVRLSSVARSPTATESEALRTLQQLLALIPLMVLLILVWHQFMILWNTMISLNELLDQTWMPDRVPINYFRMKQ